MAISQVQDVRLSVGDFDPALPILTDDVIEYYIDKNNGSLSRASVDAARAILMILSTRGDETVDIFRIRGSATAASYMESLKLFLRDPSLNPLYNNAQAYASGISVSDMKANNSNIDNVASHEAFNHSGYHHLGGFNVSC